jgi:hypothetical protein
MEAIRFNPYDYIEKPEKQVQPVPVAKPKSTTGIANDIEVVVTRIESYRLDLTATYTGWLSIGFSLAAELGESGRGYFHRLSRFHPDYNYEACNAQFSKCLKRDKNGVSIRTFFFSAKQAGIDIRV